MKTSNYACEAFPDKLKPEDEENGYGKTPRMLLAKRANF
jgi:hypothetical protein